jgi:hypothetical protein
VFGRAEAHMASKGHSTGKGGAFVNKKNTNVPQNPKKASNGAQDSESLPYIFETNFNQLASL